jgi:lipid-A-disaccharide synthase
MSLDRSVRRRGPATIFLSAAEASGDAHAAKLIRSLRTLLPDARFIGVAGEQMAAAGCEVVEDMTKNAGMLAAPVLKAGYYYRRIRRIQKVIASLAPDVHVPVDSPALNWHLARASKDAGSSVVYYIAPQVWAWAPWRVKKLAALADHVACILPFEQEYLRARGVNATYVGHPICEDAPQARELPDITDAWFTGSWRVALLPGSRPAEIRGHTDPLIAVAKAIRRRWPKARCSFAAINDASAADIRRRIDRQGANDIDVVVGTSAALEVLSTSSFAVAGSGTVTLQAAWYGVPMVIFYRTGLLMRALYRTVGRCKRLLATPHLSLVNILAGRRLVPELMPWKGDTRQLIRSVLEVMNDLGYLHEVRAELKNIVARLHTPQSASDNAAGIIAGYVR